MPGVMSPSPQNISIPTGFCLLKLFGATSFTALGQCSKIEYTPKITPLPHITDMTPIRATDRLDPTLFGGEITVDMEESTAYNLSLALMGTTDFTNPAAVTVNIMNNTAFPRGEFQFWGVNDVGPRWFMDLTNVAVMPNGAIPMISGGQHRKIPVKMEHLIDAGGLWGTQVLLPDISVVAPSNIIPPFIEGLLNPGDTTNPYAQVGQVLTARTGLWTGNYTSVTYQWKGNNVALVGQTNYYYTPVSGDIGTMLTVEVTFTNANGSTSVTSAATLAVHS
jgi:hypothetical protein